MTNENTVLEKENGQGLSEIVICNYDGKEIRKEEAYYSPCNIPYCNKKCFDMFTED